MKVKVKVNFSSSNTDTHLMRRLHVVENRDGWFERVGMTIFVCAGCLSPGSKLPQSSDTDMVSEKRKVKVDWKRQKESESFLGCDKYIREKLDWLAGE